MRKYILPSNFYLSDQVETLSQALLGKFLVTQIDGLYTAGMIVETECYKGPEDKASHAYNHRRTARTETMYAEGGVAYIYLCYGLHHLFNIVTAEKEIPHAVLVRAVEPVAGVSIMLMRRKMQQAQYKLTAGPGVLTVALGITKKHDGHKLTKSPVWIEDRKISINKKDILASPRVGIDYAAEYRDLPWRFRLRNSKWTSK